MSLRNAFRCFAAVLTIAVPVLCFAASPAPPRIELTTSQLEISNLSPGKDAIIAGVSLAQFNSTPLQRRFTEIIPDDDHDGRIVFRPNGGVPLRSIWVVVDTHSGEMAIAAPADYKLRNLDFPRHGLKGDNEGHSSLELDRFEVQLVFIRPKTGAWEMHGFAANQANSDGQGRLKLSFENARAIGSSGKAPKHLKDGDVIVAIDPSRMEVFTVTVGK